MTDSLAVSDQAAAAVAVAPRVAIADIEAAIADRFYFSGADAARASLAVNGVVDELSREHHLAQLPDLGTTTFCLVVMRNGFTVIGKSAPASAANFNAELGRKFALEDCMRQIWPLMGFALRERLVERPPDA